MARPKKHDGVVYERGDSKIWWMRYRDTSGRRHLESTGTEDWGEAQCKLRERLQARDNRTLEVVRYRSVRFLAAGGFNAGQHRAVSQEQAQEESPCQNQGRLSRTGFAKGDDCTSGTPRAAQIIKRGGAEKLLPANPCAAVEFPVRIRGLFRPHYITWSEQQMIEFHAPEHLRNVVRIITKKDQVDLENAVVWIPDSKAPNGVAEVPLTSLSAQVFQDQIRIAGPGPYLFPSDRNPSGHQTTLKTVWHKTLKRANVSYFRIYDLRSTYATRLSAGGRSG
jgi:integrase